MNNISLRHFMLLYINLNERKTSYQIEQLQVRENFAHLTLMLLGVIHRSSNGMTRSYE